MSTVHPSPFFSSLSIFCFAPIPVLFQSHVSTPASLRLFLLLPPFSFFLISYFICSFCFSSCCLRIVFFLCFFLFRFLFLLLVFFLFFSYLLLLFLFSRFLYFLLFLNNSLILHITFLFISYSPYFTDFFPLQFSFSIERAHCCHENATDTCNTVGSLRHQSSGGSRQVGLRGITGPRQLAGHLPQVHWRQAVSRSASHRCSSPKHNLGTLTVH